MQDVRFGGGDASCRVVREAGFLLGANQTYGRDPASNRFGSITAIARCHGSRPPNRKDTRMKRTWLACGLLSLVASLAFAASTSWAFANLTDQRSTCTSPNCQSITTSGTYVHFREEGVGATKAIPAVYQLYTHGGECVRVEVTFQASPLDLQAVLSCPDGTTWRDDDSGGDLRPLIQALTPSVAGWCTLQLADWRGHGTAGARDFKFRYGRYRSDNSNCANPTFPLQDDYY